MPHPNLATLRREPSREQAETRAIPVSAGYAPPSPARSWPLSSRATASMDSRSALPQLEIKRERHGCLDLCQKVIRHSAEPPLKPNRWYRAEALYVCDGVPVEER